MKSKYTTINQYFTIDIQKINPYYFLSNNHNVTFWYLCVLMQR